MSPGQTRGYYMLPRGTDFLGASRLCKGCNVILSGLNENGLLSLHYWGSLFADLCGPVINSGRLARKSPPTPTKVL
jgi:hypothetical protein